MANLAYCPFGAAQASLRTELWCNIGETFGVVVLISLLKKLGQAGIALAVGLLMLAPVQAADPNKVVRLAFRVAELLRG